MGHNCLMPIIAHFRCVNTTAILFACVLGLFFVFMNIRVFMGSVIMSVSSLLTLISFKV